MMHAWMRLQGYCTLSQDVEERICQVMAHTWLTGQLVSSTGGNMLQDHLLPERQKKGQYLSLEKKLGISLNTRSYQIIHQFMEMGLELAITLYRNMASEGLEHICMTGRFSY